MRNAASPRSSGRTPALRVRAVDAAGAGSRSAGRRRRRFGEAIATCCVTGLGNHSSVYGNWRRHRVFHRVCAATASVGVIGRDARIGETPPALGALIRPAGGVVGLLPRYDCRTGQRLRMAVGSGSVRGGRLRARRIRACCLVWPVVSGHAYDEACRMGCPSRRVAGAVRRVSAAPLRVHVTHFARGSSR